MASLRNNEGYLLLDHRDSPGITDDLAIKAGLPAGIGRGRYEAPTYTCSHCNRVVFMLPDRVRPRAYCAGCDHQICDPCATIKANLGGECRPFKKLIDDLQAAASRSTGE